MSNAVSLIPHLAIYCYVMLFNNGYVVMMDTSSMMDNTLHVTTQQTAVSNHDPLLVLTSTHIVLHSVNVVSANHSI